MPDTTTPNLGLTKIEVGASENTWGGKINDNMDLLDSQVALRGANNGFTVPQTIRQAVTVAAETAGGDASVYFESVGGSMQGQIRYNTGPGDLVIHNLRGPGSTIVLAENGDVLVNGSRVLTNDYNPNLQHNQIGSVIFALNVGPNSGGPGTVFPGSDLRSASVAATGEVIRSLGASQMTGQWVPRGYVLPNTATIFVKVSDIP
ncbi:hypothetical protein PE067_16190 [Paracoccus sp. DMF-8]|uniref:hypothetical protein n=1 Tax=Paracoccus sp. DMF-8 TaxID=3019445 RepID=UPI0023E43724|nr:hypothetical protein [Paracoccus sp. DMF-8]MDF3607548.1 hypothetical protein [Paracoccus sp. DMF-8]